MFKKPQNLKDLTVNLVLGHFKQCSRIQILLLFCRMNPYGFYGINLNTLKFKYILWNKFQDYQLKFILTNHFLATA